MLPKPLVSPTKKYNIKYIGLDQGCYYSTDAGRHLSQQILFKSFLTVIQVNLELQNQDMTQTMILLTAVHTNRLVLGELRFNFKVLRRF